MRARTLSLFALTEQLHALSLALFHGLFAFSFLLSCERLELVLDGGEGDRVVEEGARPSNEILLAASVIEEELGEALARGVETELLGDGSAPSKSRGVSFDAVFDPALAHYVPLFSSEVDIVSDVDHSFFEELLKVGMACGLLSRPDARSFRGRFRSV